jgi:uncharacterized membrane protein (UPF0127 family)
VSAKPHFLKPLLTAAGVAGHRLVHQRTGLTVASVLELAHDSATRTRGLLGRDGLADDSVMIIAPCNAIHTLFMRFTIDVVFVDRQGRVRKLCPRLRPWRAAAAIRGFAALELPEGSIDRYDIVLGDSLTVS